MQFYYLQIDNRFKPGNNSYAIVFLKTYLNKTEFDNFLVRRNAWYQTVNKDKRVMSMPASCIKKVFGYLITDFASWCNNPPIL